MGFGEAIDLPERPLSPTEWGKMLRGGRPFNDVRFMGGKLHGVYTHRLQWVIVSMDYLRNGDSPYGNKSPAELYKELGEMKPQLMEKVWNTIFDALSPTQNFTRPEFMRTKLMYWPLVNAWPSKAIKPLGPII